jgi:hypothetical protein
MINSASKYQPFARRNDEKPNRRIAEPAKGDGLFAGWGPNPSTRNRRASH